MSFSRDKDISKEDLYNSVKALLEVESPHIHLVQQKLFTLFSLAFQYLLYRSTKESGAYIIRIEDSALLEKLSRKAKDPSSRKFLQSLGLPRKLKYGKSTFYLDFFHIGSWSMTNDIPKERIKGALIVKNTSSKPMTEVMVPTSEESEEMDEQQVLEAALPKDYYLTSLLEFVPKTITVAYDVEFVDLEKVEFPFIKKEKDNYQGLTLSHEIDVEQIDD